jgi:hypothetical protein
MNNIRGKKKTNTIPTLVINNIKYESDEQKANLFLNNLKLTFSSINNVIFDNEFKLKNEKKLKTQISLNTNTTGKSYLI